MSAENINTRQTWRGIAAGDPSFHPAECQGIRKENQTPQEAVMGYWRGGSALEKFQAETEAELCGIRHHGSI